MPSIRMYVNMELNNDQVENLCSLQNATVDELALALKIGLSQLMTANESFEDFKVDYDVEIIED